MLTRMSRWKASRPDEADEPVRGCSDTSAAVGRDRDEAKELDGDGIGICDSSGGESEGPSEDANVGEKIPAELPDMDIGVMPPRLPLRVDADAVEPLGTVIEVGALDDERARENRLEFMLTALRVAEN
jgi:hypothetical protein